MCTRVMVTVILTTQIFQHFSFILFLKHAICDIADWLSTSHHSSNYTHYYYLLPFHYAVTSMRNDSKKRSL
jgi:hypothetical protein